MEKVKFQALFITLFISFFIAAANASEVVHEEVNYSQNEKSYGSKIGHKAANGLVNVASAILEIPKNIINTTNDSNVAYGFVGGLVKGILNTAGRVVSGVTDIITIPIPTKPIAQPAYIWDDFDVDTSYGDAFRLQQKKENL